MADEFEKMMQQATDLSTPGDMEEAMPSLINVVGAGFGDIDGHATLITLVLDIQANPDPDHGGDFPKLKIEITPRNAMLLLSELANAMLMEPPRGPLPE